MDPSRIHHCTWRFFRAFTGLSLLPLNKFDGEKGKDTLTLQ